MTWTTEQLAQMARLADECLELPANEHEAWRLRMQVNYPDMADSIAAMASARLQLATQSPPALTLPAEPDEHQPGTGAVVGPFRLLNLLGQGGMSTVWLAEQVDGRVHRRVALKLLSPQLIQAGWRRRFERERDILAKLTHPGIARLIDAGETPQGQAYLAMDFIDGIDIVRYASEPGVTLRVCVEQMVSLLDAVAYAHEHSVVHRDIKPSNVLVDRYGHVVLLDFGIAKLLLPELSPDAAPESELTALYGAALTLDYASPEQVAGLAVGPASDVYSAGVLLFELLTGERPYRLSRRTRAALEEAILEQDLPMPSQRVGGSRGQRLGSAPDALASQLLGPLDAVVSKALQRDATQRYPTARAFADDLRRWLAGQPVEAIVATQPVGVSTVVHGPVPATAPAPQTGAGPAKRIRDQIREHLIPTNTVISLSLVLVSLVDMLAPRVLPLALAMRNVAIAVAALLLVAAIWPGAVDRLLIRLRLMSSSPGQAALLTQGQQMFSRSWLLPAIFVTVALSATLSMADSGGVIASHAPSLRTLQRQLLGLQSDVSQIGAGVTQANEKLDAMAVREQALQGQMAASPLAVGLLELQATGASPQTDGSWPARLAVYLNAPGYDLSELRLRMRTGKDGGQVMVYDLSSALGGGTGPAAVQIMVNLPGNTGWIQACLLLPASAGSVSRALVHRWRVTTQTPAALIRADGAPQVLDGDKTACEA